jgi:hypothetical protein
MPPALHETALRAKDSEVPGAGVQAIETVVCAGPEVATTIDEQGQNVVVAQALGIRRVVPVCLEPPGPAVEPV